MNTFKALPNIFWPC
jgi:hypothetical protein